MHVQDPMLVVAIVNEAKSTLCVARYPYGDFHEEGYKVNPEMHPHHRDPQQGISCTGTSERNTLPQTNMETHIVPF